MSFGMLRGIVLHSVAKAAINVLYVFVFLSDFEILFASNEVCNVGIHPVVGWFCSWLIELYQKNVFNTHGKNVSIYD